LNAAPSGNRINSAVREPLIQISAIVFDGSTKLQMGRGRSVIADDSPAAPSAQERSAHADVVGGGAFI
jgi:hypothetical protein